jgi:Dehydrogenases (flavoproteins)
MTQRRRLDAFLVDQAASAGAEFRDGVHVEVESDTALRVDGDGSRSGRSSARTEPTERPPAPSGSAERS